MNRCCIYKLRKGMELNPIREMFSRYVYVIDFAKNPLKTSSEGATHAIYHYIDIEDLSHGSPLLGLEMLPYEDFKEYFELHWDVGQINEKVRSLEVGDNR